MYKFVIISLISLTCLINLSLCDLQLQTIELYPDYNTRNHHTNFYERAKVNGDLVLRRGDSFRTRLDLSEPYNPSTHAIIYQFSFGGKRGYGRKIALQLKNSPQFPQNDRQWDINFHSSSKNSVDILVYIPANAAVGIWNLRVKLSDQTRSQTYSIDNDIPIIFNPWSRSDTVYMADDAGRQEYVLNDMGKLYMGTYGDPEAREWIFGQFKHPILKAAMFILDKSGLNEDQRSDPVLVSSALSSLVNNVDNNGVVYGKWEKPYTPHKAPWEWTGSYAIIKQYYETNGQPVRYGQCWVFASVLNTLCRALGMATRPITNYGSAHDSNRNLFIERYFDQNGQPINTTKTRDSIWNFHIWNEVWMERPDLGSQYSGWQVIDGTPQEPSPAQGNQYRTGPAPVKAVKSGEVAIRFDVPFVVAEVNADIQDYLYDTFTRNYKPLKPKTRDIGLLLVTKRKGYINRGSVLGDAEDVTNTYKHSEGSQEERSTFQRARRELGFQDDSSLQYGPNSISNQNSEDDVSMQFKMSNGGLIGLPFNVTLYVKNRSNQRRTASLSIILQSFFYTGMLGNVIKEVKSNVQLQPKESKHIWFLMRPSDYIDKLVDLSMIKIIAVMSVFETKVNLRETFDFKLESPKLFVMINGQDVNPAVRTQVYVGQSITVGIKLLNPLSQALIGGVFTIEGNHFGPKDFPAPRIGAGEYFTLQVRMTLTRPGVERLLITFSSRELSNVFGRLDLIVS